ncbi:MAG: porin family protein [Blastocatellia bacterium]|nr:porin family protein [Blastocatellia bacterium]
MCKGLFIVVLLCLLPLQAAAQETPNAELFGGYSFIHKEGDETLHGWHFSVNGNLNKWFGLVADFSGHYDSSESRFRTSLTNLPFFSSDFKSEERIHTAMVGPRFSYRDKEKITPFAHTLFGVARKHDESLSILNDTDRFFFSDNSTKFAFALGGGLDVKLSNTIALRVIQADYLVSRLGFNNNRHNLRASAGIVFRFGNK